MFFLPLKKLQMNTVFPGKQLIVEFHGYKLKLSKCLTSIVQAFVDKDKDYVYTTHLYQKLTAFNREDIILIKTS